MRSTPIQPSHASYETAVPRAQLTRPRSGDSPAENLRPVSCSTGMEGIGAASAREFPAHLTWSHSKDNTLASCARRFGLHYVLSKGGWRTDAPSDVREAFRLKKLETLPTAVGSAVHRRATECVRAVTEGLPLPSLDALCDRTRSELNALVRSSRNIAAFEANPSRVAMLREVYYHADGALEPAHVEAARATMLTALETLFHLPLWDELRSLQNLKTSILIPDPFFRFRYNGRHVYAAPDLVFRFPSEDQAKSDAKWCIVDFKTGKTANHGEVDQVALYALMVDAALGWPVGEGCEGRVINLALDTVDCISLTADDLADAAKRIESGTDRLWAMLLDDAGVPRSLSREDFPMTSRNEQCSYCAFKAACHPGIATAVAARRAAAA